MIALFCSQKTISIVKKNYIKKKKKKEKKNGDLYCLNCLHSCRTKNKLESHKRACEKGFCSIVMPSEDTKVL